MGPFATQLVPIPKRQITPNLSSCPRMAVPKVFRMPACVRAITGTKKRDVNNYVTAAGVDIVDSILELIVGDPLGEHVAFRCLFCQKNVRARGVSFRHEPSIFVKPIP